MALEHSELLTCAPGATPDLTECVDPWLDYAYQVRWGGSFATVYTAVGDQQLGTLTHVQTNTFEVTTFTESAGICTIELGALPYAEFCFYDE